MPASNRPRSAQVIILMRFSSHMHHVTRHTSHVTRHTSHVTRHTSHVTRHKPHITHHTSRITRHTSHITHHTSHVTHARIRLHLLQCGRLQAGRACSLRQLSHFITRSQLSRLLSDVPSFLSRSTISAKPTDFLESSSTREANAAAGLRHRPMSAMASRSRQV